MVLADEPGGDEGHAENKQQVGENGADKTSNGAMTRQSRPSSGAPISHYTENPRGGSLEIDIFYIQSQFKTATHSYSENLTFLGFPGRLFGELSKRCY